MDPDIPDVPMAFGQGNPLMPNGALQPSLFNGKVEFFVFRVLSEAHVTSEASFERVRCINIVGDPKPITSVWLQQQTQNKQHCDLATIFFSLLQRWNPHVEHCGD
jgi:hypothetical protein